MRLLQRLGFQGVVAEAIEVAGEAEVVLGPDALEGADEFLGTPIALVMVEPGLADAVEFALEPAGHQVDGDPAVGELVDGRQLLGRQRRIPGAGQDGGDHLETLGGGQQRMAEGHRLMLVFGAVAGGETDLRQGVVEAGLLGQLGQRAVVVDAPVGALLDGADHQAAADVGDPIGEFDGVLRHAKALRVGLAARASETVTLSL